MFGGGVSYGYSRRLVVERLRRKIVRAHSSGWDKVQHLELPSVPRPSSGPLLFALGLKNSFQKK
jgi:hypothetical protein